VAEPFISAISPAGAPLHSFPQEVLVSRSVMYHIVFSALIASYNFKW